MFGYEVKRASSIDVQIGYETKKEAIAAVPRGYKGIIFSYSDEISEHVEKCAKNGCMDPFRCKFVADIRR